MKENSENLQYNSCISKGICSVNPRVFALQNVLVLYLCMCAKYCLKLLEKGALTDEVSDFILNTTEISILNPDFTEDCFMYGIDGLKKVLIEAINKYNDLYGKNDFKGENLYESEIYKKCENLVDTIKFGEEIFRERASNLSAVMRDMYKLMLIIAKSISINLMDLNSYGKRNAKGLKALLKLISSVDANNSDIEKLKKIIIDGSACNNELMIKLHEIQEARYGKQSVYEVSYTTTPSKAVLVVGSNIRELETVLESLKNTDIDIYTHDEMMVAHTFPKFKEYKNLKGQYGYGVENCLIDFATFPGPIILTKHSLHNIENLYRGRLFTTDVNFYKGVIKIENDDYLPVSESAKEAKGFKRGKTCDTVKIGYDFQKCIESIDNKFVSQNYKKIVVIGLKEYSEDDSNYFERLIKNLSPETLIISFSYNFKQDNFIHFNTCFDSFAVVRIFKHLLDYKVPLSIFLPKCGRNTIAEIIHFGRYEGVKTFLGKCEPIMIDPSLMSSLESVFGVQKIDNPQKDAEEINNL